jgi:zinc protease
VKFPPYEIRTLPNGLQVMAVLHHEQPAVTVRLLTRAGSASDPEGKPGVASLVATLLDQGTTTKSAKQIATTIDGIGGALSVGAGSDLTFANVIVMKDSFQLALDLLADVIRRPAFAPEEIERQRQQIMSGFQVSYEDPEYVAGLVFDRLVYGFNPYGLPNSGTPASIGQIGREDLLAFHKQNFGPNNTILAVVGDVTAAEAFAGVERAFGDWARIDVPDRKPLAPPDPTRRIVVVDKPDAVQTEIRVGHIGIPRKHPDYMALDLAVKILGGEGSNRLHRVLRSERGLTYGASVEMDALLSSGNIVAETDTRSEATAEALRLIVDEFWNIQRERVGQRELGDAQAYLTGHFPLTIETPNAIALQVLNVLFYGLDPSEVETYRERVNAVTVDDIQRVARAYLKPDRLSIVLVGNAAAFADQLRGVGFGQFERVALADLDIMAADFRRAPRRAAAASLGPVNHRVAAAASEIRIVPASASRAVPAPARADRARELVAQAVAAKGGVEKLRSVKTVKATSRTILQTSRGPVTAETVTYIGYPDRFRVEARLPMGEIVQTYAAGEAWVKDPTGLHVAPPPVAAEFRGSVARDLIPLLLRAESGDLQVRLASSGGTQVADAEAVELSGADLEPVTLHIDTRTGLVLRQTHEVKGPTGKETAEEVFSDYRLVDGVQIAFKAIVQRNGRPIIERIVTDFQVNAELDPGLFVKPS